MDMEDIGALRIREIITSFNIEKVSEKIRCGCPLPCLKRIIKIQEFEAENATDTNFIVYQVIM